jgi:hypothetical protein
VNAAFCVVVDLPSSGALTWDYSWWNVRSPIPIFVFGYLTFFLVSYWVHDMRSVRSKVATVAVIFGVDIVAAILFGGMLGWI